MGVTDATNNPTSLLGDFHYATGTKQSTDYNYDANGNLTHDNNKAIDTISHNYLNLPQLVHLNTKGNIAYTYDATVGWRSGGGDFYRRSWSSTGGLLSEV
jgi:hypothetical protein